jgi:hypothetical protein
VAARAGRRSAQPTYSLSCDVAAAGLLAPLNTSLHLRPDDRSLAEQQCPTPTVRITAEQPMSGTYLFSCGGPLVSSLPCLYLSIDVCRVDTATRWLLDCQSSHARMAWYDCPLWLKWHLQEYTIRYYECCAKGGERSRLSTPCLRNNNTTGPGHDFIDQPAVMLLAA